jgi:hypothetical protein
MSSNPLFHYTVARATADERLRRAEARQAAAEARRTERDERSASAETKRVPAGRLRTLRALLQRG